MTDPLAQSEIDALVHAVGQAPAARSLQIFSRLRKDFENVEIREYDFKRPERISKAQMQALETLHDGFGRSMGALLSGQLRMIVEVRVSAVEQITYDEFIHRLPAPTTISLLEAPPLEGLMCLEVSPLVVYPIIDRLLGGTTRDLVIPQREATAIEVRIIRTVLERAVTALGEAWSSVRALQFKLGEMESNPALVQIVPPNELVVVIGFEVKIGGRAGTMSLCIPFKAIEPLVGELSAESWAAPPARPGGPWEARLNRHLVDVPVEVSGILCRSRITMGELRRLEVGDLISTEHPATAPAVLAVSGRPKHHAAIGRFQGNVALRILRPASTADRPA